MTIKRFIFTFVLLGAALFAPWWVTLALALCGAFYFPDYYEVVFIGIMMDLLYGVRGGLGVGYGVWGLVAGTLIVLGLERLKRELR